MKNAIYMLESVTGAQMNGFIITSEGGKVVVVDGGWTCDLDTLISRLREITGQDTPHIDAWFLSHSHEDHIDAFLKLFGECPDAIRIDGKIYYNFPSVQFFAHEDKSAVRTATLFYNLLPRFAHKACIISGGDSYEIGDMRFDILYSPMYEFKRASCNNSSIVFRLTLGGKTAIFLGDCSEAAGDKLIELYGESLKSDICQMAHHGQHGVSRRAYEIISPEVCFWNTPAWLWDNDIGKGFNTHIFDTVNVRRWMEEIGVRRNLVAKDGAQVYEW